MHITMVLDQFYPLGDGTELSALTLCRELQQLGHTVRVLASWKQGLSYHDEVGGILVQRVPWIPTGRIIRRIGKYTWVAGLVRRLIQWAPATDVIHCHMAYFHIIAAVIAGTLCRRPVIVKVAAGDPGGDLARMSNSSIWDGEEIGFLVVWILKYVDTIVALSAQVERELRARGYARIVTIPNGVDPMRFHPAAASEYDEARTALGLPADALLVGFMGRLHEQKAPEVLLEAWRHSQLSAQSAILCLAGVGEMELLLRGLAARPGAGPIRFLGRVDSETFFRAMDAFVLPSRYEGMSNALLEAMASGLPCVGTMIGGTEDLIEDGVSGLLVPPDDAEALASAIDQLSSVERRSSLGLEARRRIEEGFTIRLVAQRYARLYQELVTRGRGAGRQAGNLADDPQSNPSPHA